MARKFANKAKARAFYTNLSKRAGSVESCLAKWLARSERDKPAPTSRIELRKKRAQKLRDGVLVSLGSAGEAAFEAVKEANSAFRNWALGAVATADLAENRHIVQFGSNSDWRKRSTFRRGVWVYSVVSGNWQTITLKIDLDSHTIHAPRGYRWDADEDGLCLRGVAGDYHPTASELIEAASCRCKNLIESLKRNAATRKRVKRELAAQAKANKAAQKKKAVDEKRRARQEASLLKQAEREGCMVCLADSIRAGNCFVGSHSWATRFGLDPAQHYRPSEILAKADADRRVMLVVAVAVKRHTEEMRRGYALLSEHRS
jgi:hypothetical protein